MILFISFKIIFFSLRRNMNDLQVMLYSNISLLLSVCNRCNAIPMLCDVLSEANKEKVTRIVLATFRVSG